MNSSLMSDFLNKISLTLTLLSSERYKHSGSRWSPKIPEPTLGRKFHAQIRGDTQKHSLFWGRLGGRDSQMCTQLLTAGMLAHELSRKS